MRKLLLSLSFLFFIFSATYSQEVQIDYIKLRGAGTYNGCTSQTGNTSEFGPIWTNWHSVPHRALYGHFSQAIAYQGGGYQDAYGLNTHGRHMDNGTWVRGDAYAIQFPFRQGFTYSITVEAIWKGPNGLDLGDGADPNLKPHLQFAMTNDLTPWIGQLCTVSAEPKNFNTISSPHGSIFSTANFGAVQTQTITLPADVCYQYLMIGTFPDLSGESVGTIYIRSVKVKSLQTDHEVVGNPSVCYNSSQTYTVYRQGSPINVPVTFELSDPSIPSSSTSNSITLTNVHENKKIRLTASFTNSCGIVERLYKDVTLGTPSVSEFTINGASVTPQNMSSKCIDGYADLEVSIVDVELSSTYTWSDIYGGDFRFGQGTPDVGITTNCDGQYLYFTVQPQNSCGMGDPTNMIVPLCGCENAVMVYEVSPNPARDIVRIKKKNSSTQNNSEKAGIDKYITEVILLDQTGVVKSIIRPKEKSDQVQLNVSNFRPGIYFLMISNGKQREKHQIIITR